VGRRMIPSLVLLVVIGAYLKTRGVLFEGVFIGPDHVALGGLGGAGADLHPAVAGVRRPGPAVGAAGLLHRGQGHRAEHGVIPVPGGGGAAVRQLDAARGQYAMNAMNALNALNPTLPLRPLRHRAPVRGADAGALRGLLEGGGMTSLLRLDQVSKPYRTSSFGGGVLPALRQVSFDRTSRPSPGRGCASTTGRCKGCSRTRSVPTTPSSGPTGSSS
jgi:hypothetical protein